MRKLLSVFAAFAMALTILTGSIALPLLIRPFYRAQIEPLSIPARSGLTAEQIGAAFDDVMDYCLGKRPDFAAGVLSFSQEGASHFADVRRLFLLDLRVLAVCMAASLLSAPAGAAGAARRLFAARGSPVSISSGVCSPFSCQLMRMRLRYAHLRAPVATTVRSYASAMASQPKPMSSQLVM